MVLLLKQGVFVTVDQVKYRGAYNPTLSDYLESMVKVDPNGCWIWQGAVGSKGYGAAYHNGRTLGAHRLAYRCEHGELPPAPAVIRHRCDVRKCINPQHLIAGTHADNARDRVSRGRSARQQGALNGRAILSGSDIPSIRASDATLSALAQKYGVGATTIADIRKGRRWKHIPMQQSGKVETKEV